MKTNPSILPSPLNEFGSPLPPTLIRNSCAKCGKKLYLPCSIHDASDGYCFDCRWLLGLAHGYYPDDLAGLGYPPLGQFKYRLIHEPPMYRVRRVEFWYEVGDKPSPEWAERCEREKMNNRRLGLSY